VLDVLHVQKDSRVFVKGKDFNVENDQLVWTKNKNARPDDGSTYSIMYERRPIYIILGMMNHHRDVADLSDLSKTRAMPLRATGKLDFLVKDEAREQQAIKAKSPFSKPNANQG
jgi:hypothetical protein